MTEAEAREWMGVGPEVPVKPAIFDALASVPVPTDDASEVAAFKVFLAAAGTPAPVTHS